MRMTSLEGSRRGRGTRVKGNPGCKLHSETNPHTRPQSKSWSGTFSPAFPTRFWTAQAHSWTTHATEQDFNMEQTEPQKSRRATLTFAQLLAWHLQRGPVSSFPLFCSFFFFFKIIISRCHRHQKGGTEMGWENPGWESTVTLYCEEKSSKYQSGP